MILYFIKSTFLLLVFYFIYKIALQDKKSLKFNRFYLISTPILGLILPFINFSFFVTQNPITETKQIVIEEIESFSSLENLEIIQNQNFITNLEVFFLSITLLFLIKFTFNIFSILKLKNKGEKIKNEYGNIILHSKVKTPFSFINNMYINSKAWNNKKIETEILLHEQGHIKEKHSIDIITIEVLKILFWFQPMLYLYKKAIQENHEYLADSYCIKKIKNINNYQHIILNYYSEQNKSYELSSSFNYENLKKRFIMMKNTKKGNVNKVVFYTTAFVLTYFSLVGFETKAETINKVENTISNKIENLIENEIVNEIVKNYIRNNSEEVISKNNEISIIKYKKGEQNSGFLYSNKHEGTFFYVVSENKEVTIYDRNGIKQNEKEFEYKLEEIIDEVKKSESNLNFNETNNNSKVILEYTKGEKKAGYLKINEETYYYIISPNSEVSFYNRYGVLQNNNIVNYELKEITNENTNSNQLTQEIEAYLALKDELQNTNNEQSETKAGPKEGIQQFYKDFISLINIPSFNEDLEYKVLLKMVVEEDGSLTNFTTENKGTPIKEIDDSILEVIKKMPKWNPATKDGKPIISNYNLPITIKMKI